MSDNNSIRRELRARLDEYLKTDSDFDAFCLDYFPKVKRLFSDGMDRIRKTTLLLEKVDLQLLQEKLLTYIMELDSPKIGADGFSTINSIDRLHLSQIYNGTQSNADKTTQNQKPGEQLLQNASNSEGIDSLIDLLIFRAQQITEFLNKKELLRFNDLHQAHIAALRKNQHILAHEISRQIHDFFSKLPPRYRAKAQVQIVYCKRLDNIEIKLVPRLETDKSKK